jgi:5-methylcytosine-specific restriction endonuclease McrA
VDLFWLTQPGHLRSLVYERDVRDTPLGHLVPCARCHGESPLGPKTNWARVVREVDHTVPIVEGGHPFDLANLRSLCRPCHKIETAELRTRMAAYRRSQLEVVA